MGNQEPPANYLQTTSTKRSQPGPKHSGELFTGSPAELVDRLNKPASGRAEIPELQGREAKLMTGLFARMKSIYGHLWSSNWTDEAQLAVAKLDWLNAIRRGGFTEPEVAAALDYCASTVPKMPNLPVFISIARQSQYQVHRKRENDAGRKLIAATPEQVEQQRAVQAKEMDRYRAIGKEHLKGIKNIFV